MFKGNSADVYPILFRLTPNLPPPHIYTYTSLMMTAAEEYDRMLPSIKTLCQEYHLTADAAYFMARSRQHRAISERITALGDKVGSVQCAGRLVSSLPIPLLPFYLRLSFSPLLSLTLHL